MYRCIYIALLAALALGGCRAARNQPGSLPSGVEDRTSAVQRDLAPAPDVELQGELTLAEAAALALLHNPRLAAVSLETRAAEARELQASLRPNPELEVEIESLAGTDERSGFDGAETTVSLGQLIELGGKRAKRTRLASLATGVAEKDFESQRLDTLRDVAQAFVALLAAQERLALADQLHELSEQARSVVAQRVEAGKDSAVENLRAGVASSQSQIGLRKARRDLATARQTLAATWGAKAASFQKAAGDFYGIMSLPAVSDANAMVATNPDVMRWAVAQRQRESALELEKARATSDITVAAGVQRFEETDDSAFVVGVALPIPLFDRNQGGIKEAVANLARARKLKQAAEIEVAAALGKAMNDLAAAQAEVRILEGDVLPKAEQAFEAVRKGYREGKFDYLYVLDTQRTFFETKVQYIDAVEAYHLARTRVERLIGQPLKETEHEG